MARTVQVRKTRTASDNHIKGVPGIKPDVRQSKSEGVLNCIAVSLSSMFLPSISPCYISVLSYYLLYFASCADVSRLSIRDLRQIPKNVCIGANSCPA